MLEGSGPRGRNLSPQRDSLIAPHRHRPSWPPGVVTSRADMLRTRPEVSPEVLQIVETTPGDSNGINVGALKMEHFGPTSSIGAGHRPLK